MSTRGRHAGRCLKLAMVILASTLALPARPSTDNQKTGKTEPAGLPLELRLHVKKDTYPLDVGGKKPDEFRKFLKVNPYSVPAPMVILVAELRNTGTRELSFFGAPGPQLVIEGPDANSVDVVRSNRFYVPPTHEFTLGPGMSVKIPIRRLRYTESYDEKSVHWMNPGTYRLTAVFPLGVSPAPRGTKALPHAIKKDFGGVKIISAPVKLNVRQVDSITFWADALKDPEAEVRQAAALALAEKGPAAKDCLPALVGALKDKNDDVRGAAIGALTAIGRAAKTARPDLLDALKDPIPAVRAAGIHALVKIAPENTGQAISPMMKDAHAIVRQAAAEGLGEIRQDIEEPIAALMARIDDENTAVRQAVITSLGRIGAKQAVPSLIEMLKDEKRRGIAMNALGSIGPKAKDAVPALTSLLKEEKGRGEEMDGTREMAAWTLLHIGPDAAPAVPALIEALADKDSGTRIFVAKALGAIGPGAKQAVPALAQALRDKDESVRIYAAESLGYIGPDATAAVPDLAALLKDKRAQVRDPAATALGKIGPGAKAALPALVATLKDAQEQTRWLAAQALTQIGPAGKEAVPALKEALADKNVSVRLFTAVALGQIGPDAGPAVPALIERLGEDQYLVREATAVALGRIGSAAKKAVPGLTKMLEDKYYPARKAAAEALHKIKKDDDGQRP